MTPSPFLTFLAFLTRLRWMREALGRHLDTDQTRALLEVRAG